MFLSVFPAIPLIAFFNVALRGDEKPFLIAALICIPLLLTFLLGRKGVTVHVARREIVRWWGWWLPGIVDLAIVRKRSPVEGHRQTVLEAQERHSKNSTWRVYVVSAGGERLGEFRRFLQARSRAERVANALGMPLRDETDSGRGTTRAAGTLDLPLRDRLRGEGALPAPPAPPENAVLRWERRADETVVEMPKDFVAAMRRMRIMLSILGLLAAILVAELAVETEVSTEVGWTVAVLNGVLALIGLGVIIGASRRVTLRVTAAGIRREARSWLSRWTNEIPAGRIEEVTVGAARTAFSGTVVAAWGDREIVEFGDTLPLEDLEWIRREILYRLAQSDNPGSGGSVA